MSTDTSWGPPAPSAAGVTLKQHMLTRQRRVPDATGDFTGMFAQISLAAKIIASRVNRAGLAGILGLTGEENVQGEEVRKLDLFANTVLVKSLKIGGHVCVMGSEEVEEHIPVNSPSAGKYVVLFDPLDGSGNIDINASIGTIFSVHKRIDGAGPGRLEDCLQVGRSIVAAGYMIYGSSNVLVYSTGDGVHGFTLDPAVGEFFVSNDNITIPEHGKFYSINEGNRSKWAPEVRKWADWVKAPQDDGRHPYGLRYIGAMVADFHRTLLRGGIFAYPGDSKNRNGKLRLLYEAAPLAFMAEAAGGAATTGTMPILDVVPEHLHQRTPLFIGSRGDVAEAVREMYGADAVGPALGL